MAITGPSSPRLRLKYEYEPNGNISQIEDDTRSETLDYTYDKLDRLAFQFARLRNVTSGSSKN
jgi:YD repeat-containing protein